jgi:hypothetical protein
MVLVWRRYERLAPPFVDGEGSALAPRLFMFWASVGTGERPLRATPLRTFVSGLRPGRSVPEAPAWTPGPPFRFSFLCLSC